MAQQTDESQPEGKNDDANNKELSKGKGFNKSQLQKIAIDGGFGSETKVALQAFLASNGQKLKIDGYFGKESNIALQKFLVANDCKTGIDGQWG
eukprot:874849_1